MKALAPTLLIIDDELQVLNVARLVFESSGYHVVTAASAGRGLEIFATLPVDAVVLDYEMPEMNGSAVAALMKRQRSGVPIVMFSARNCMPHDAEGVVDAFVSKGEFGGLKKKLERLLLPAPPQPVRHWRANA